VDEVVRLLSGSEAFLQSVPRGCKRDTYFLVNNDDNVRKREGKNRFWDDCGTWDSKSGHTLKSHYLCRDGSLTYVRLLSGKFCVRRNENGKRCWRPLSPQPLTEHIVCVCTYYATLKSAPDYRKRVSWIADGRSVALVEYKGEPPKEHTVHGNAKTSKHRFIRTQPQVMDAVRERVVNRRLSPRKVYEQLVATNDSMSAPRNHKQVKNVAHNAKRAVANVHVTKGTVPDDLLYAIGELQNVEQNFVQFVGFSRKSKPFVIAYMPDQMKDMKRFCATATPLHLRTVLGVDRTFNLGPCYVTCIVYKNMSVTRVSTQDHPVFLGPVLLHFDGLTETYRCFFSHVAGELDGAGVCTEVLSTDNLVFGSDDEKAMVNALRTAFPTAQHVFCARHIVENVRRHLTEKGVPVKEREEVIKLLQACTRDLPDDQHEALAAVEKLMVRVRQHHSELISYFEDHVLPKVTFTQIHLYHRPL